MVKLYKLLLFTCLILLTEGSWLSSLNTQKRQGEPCLQPNLDITCLDLNEECDPVAQCDLTNLTCEFCKYDLSCSPISRTCVERNGFTCIDDTDCNQGLLFDNTFVCGFNGSCVYRLGSTNDICDSNDDCLSNSCSGDGYCEGLAEGESCLGSLESGVNDCEYGYYCSVTCVSRPDIGDSCELIDDSNSACYLSDCIDGVCVEYGTAAYGGSCVSQFSCSPGSLCADGICEEIPAVTGGDCDNCSAAEVCGCVNQTQACVLAQDSLPDECTDLLESATDCLRDNECVEFSGAPNSCATTYCDREVRCFYDCYYRYNNNETYGCFDYLDDLDCDLDDTDTGTDTDTETETAIIDGVETTNDIFDGVVDGIVDEIVDGADGSASNLSSFLFDLLKN